MDYILLLLIWKGIARNWKTNERRWGKKRLVAVGIYAILAAPLFVIGNLAYALSWLLEKSSDIAGLAYDALYDLAWTTIPEWCDSLRKRKKEEDAHGPDHN